MCSRTQKAQHSVTAQERMFRLAERDFDLSLPILHAESGIPLRTLQSWKAGTTMPAWALGALGEAGIPDYLLSLLLHPFHRVVTTELPGEGALHEAATEATGFAHEFLNATSPNSEGGPAVTPREAARLGEKALRAGAKLRAVAS